MTYVIFGAGAIGSGIAAAFHRAAVPVVLVARGRHGEVLASDGLEYRSSGSSEQLMIPTVTSIGALDLHDDDIVVLTMKGQDTADALEALSAAADGRDVAVICAQNGVANEYLALRRFERVYGAVVYMSAQHIEPGVVEVYSKSVPGLFDVGRVPRGIDDVVTTFVADLNRSGLAPSRAVADIMRWKYGRLLRSLAHPTWVLEGAADEKAALHQRALDEAVACYSAAGIDWAAPDELAPRIAVLERDPIAEESHVGASFAQSLVNRSGRTEVDFLTGEIVLLGRLHGVPTPVNTALQRVAGEIGRRGLLPGEVPISVAYEAIEACERKLEGTAHARR